MTYRSAMPLSSAHWARTVARHDQVGVVAAQRSGAVPLPGRGHGGRGEPSNEEARGALERRPATALAPSKSATAASAGSASSSASAPAELVGRLGRVHLGHVLAQRGPLVGVVQQRPSAT